MTSKSLSTSSTDLTVQATSELRDCNYTQIEDDIAVMTNVTVNLLASVADALESILDKGNQCASEPFPTSLSCFVKLVNTCKVDIDKIKDALHTYYSLARVTGLDIIYNIINCHFIDFF